MGKVTMTPTEEGFKISVEHTNGTTEEICTVHSPDYLPYVMAAVKLDFRGVDLSELERFANGDYNG